MRIILLFVFFVFFFKTDVWGQGLKVSENGHYLTFADGTPFFWLGDTGWLLFNRLNDEETGVYLKNRAGKGFNVIQCVLAIGIEEGDHAKEEEGKMPFIDRDPYKPDKLFFKHVDRVIEKADELGLYLGILPMWGSYVADTCNHIDENSAFYYGKYLGKRYRNKTNIIWILGGDKVPDGYEKVWDSLAKGIKEGGSNNLMSYHISGEHTTSEYFQNTGWLDLNMIQSGHISAFYNNYSIIEKDYNKLPVKPVLDGEIIYEDIPIGFCPANGKATAHDVRVEAYWSVFAGAAGVTYGCNAIFQFYKNEKRWDWWADRSWEDALDTPGSFQMRYLKDLMLSRPYLSRIPDQSLTQPAPVCGVDHLQCTRDGSAGRKDATYIMVYFPYLTHKFKIKTDVIPSSKLHVWWYDPRTGKSFDKGEVENTGLFVMPWGSEIKTNGTGPDWVLVIDDASKKYPAPGIVTGRD